MGAFCLFCFCVFFFFWDGCFKKNHYFKVTLTQLHPTHVFNECCWKMGGWLLCTPRKKNLWKSSLTIYFAQTSASLSSRPFGLSLATSLSLSCPPLCPPRSFWFLLMQLVASLHSPIHLSAHPNARASQPSFLCKIITLFFSTPYN